jgi:hypothetical protein
MRKFVRIHSAGGICAWWRVEALPVGADQRIDVMLLVRHHSEQQLYIQGDDDEGHRIAGDAHP